MTFLCSIVEVWRRGRLRHEDIINILGKHFKVYMQPNRNDKAINTNYVTRRERCRKDVWTLQNMFWFTIPNEEEMSGNWRRKKIIRSRGRIVIIRFQGPKLVYKTLEYSLSYYRWIICILIRCITCHENICKECLSNQNFAVIIYSRIIAFCRRRCTISFTLKNRPWYNVDK